MDRSSTTCESKTHHHVKGLGELCLQPVRDYANTRTTGKVIANAVYHTNDIYAKCVVSYHNRIHRTFPILRVVHTNIRMAITAPQGTWTTRDADMQAQMSAAPVHPAKCERRKIACETIVHCSLSASFRPPWMYRGTFSLLHLIRMCPWIDYHNADRHFATCAPMYVD